MSKFKCDSYSGTDMIYKSKIVIHCSTYTYAELEEEYESGVIENPKEIEITSNESCEQMCSVEFTIPKDYLTDNFKNILSKAELVIHLGANDVPLLIIQKYVLPFSFCLIRRIYFNISSSERDSAFASDSVLNIDKLTRTRPFFCVPSLA